MNTAYLPTAYLGPVRWYATLLAYPAVFVEAQENYPKQTCRNRCLIAAANGPQALTVPVAKPSSPKCPTRDIRISDHGNWRHVHWNALVSAYRKSPFFDYYEEDFAPFYEKKFAFLLDFNEALRETACRLIGFSPRVLRTAEYLPKVEDDFRERFRPGRDEEAPAFRTVPYYQVFQEKRGFLPGMSIVDLLFNMGPESLAVLQASLPHGEALSARKR